jgi:hypothetical protein
MASLIHKTSSRAQAAFPLYIGKMAEYISAIRGREWILVHTKCSAKAMAYQLTMSTDDFLC